MKILYLRKIIKIRERGNNGKAKNSEGDLSIAERKRENNNRKGVRVRHVAK